MKTTIPLGDKVIAFYPVFASSFGSVAKAIYIQQLIYWSDKGKRADGFIYKTKQELEGETTLSIKQQDKCRKYFENKKILITKKIKVKGSPTIHYKINFSMLQKVILEYDKKLHSNMTKSNKPITENTTKNTNIVSKDTKEVETSPIIKSPFTKKVIKDWNLKENTKKVSLTKRTKVIQNIEKYIKQLKEGTFLKNKLLNSDLIKINKIPFKMKKLNSKQIQQVINKMTLFLQEGYPPLNKSIVGSLSEMFYSPHFQSSWFLQALYNPPKPIHVKVKDNNLETTEYLISQMNGTFEGKDRNNLIRGIKTIKEFVNNIPKNSIKQYKIRSEVGTPLKICKEYICWIKHQD